MTTHATREDAEAEAWAFVRSEAFTPGVYDLGVPPGKVRRQYGALPESTYACPTVGPEGWTAALAVDVFYSLAAARFGSHAVIVTTRAVPLADLKTPLERTPRSETVETSGAKALIRQGWRWRVTHTEGGTVRTALDYEGTEAYARALFTDPSWPN